MDKLGSLEYAKQDILSVKKQIYEETERLGGNPELIEVIDQVYDWGNDEIVECYPEFEEFKLKYEATYN